MATTELIAVGTGAADSAEVTVTAGVPVKFFLKTTASGPAPVNARVTVKAKASGGTYHEIGALTGQYVSWQIDAPGVYLFSRDAASDAVGLDKDE